MAQVIAPEVWQEGIADNNLLPDRCAGKLFIGNEVPRANNADQACRVWSILTTDYITDYDDRRINGLAGTNTHGADGWAASAYGVFQDVRTTSRIYTMGRHRSIAMRVFDEIQYGGSMATPATKWGTATKSSYKSGTKLMQTAALLSKAKDKWQKEILGPDIDKYSLFAIMNGHISGRAVGNTAAVNDKVFTGKASDYSWVAQPGPVEGADLPPRFAPIHAIEWDAENVALMLNTITVSWDNMGLEPGNRVCVIDPAYRYELLAALTGKGVPATEAGYADLQNGTFKSLMGWEFDFTVPSAYWPTLYCDKGLNVVHSANGDAAFDVVLYASDTRPGSAPYTLLKELMSAAREYQNNWIRTDWDGTQFTKTLTNYPAGLPGMDGYLGLEAHVVGGEGKENANPFLEAKVENALNYDAHEDYPFTERGGYGTGTIYDGEDETGHGQAHNDVIQMASIGMFLYKKAGQLSQEYSEMVTDEGKTRGKFTEMCMDVKYDAWAIEPLSFGIIPIVTTSAARWDVPTYDFAIPVREITEETGAIPVDEITEEAGA